MLSPAEIAAIQSLLASDPTGALDKLAAALGKQRKAAAPDRPGRMIGYARCSHEDSAKSGLGIDVQKQQIAFWRDTNLKQERFAGYRWCDTGWEGMREVGSATRDGFFIDQAVSAYRRAFMFRPAGSRIERILEPGDIVLFARMDRGFRNSYDLASTLKRWQEMGVSCCFVDLGIDTQSAVGNLIVHLFGAVAEFDSRLKSERIREALARQAERGQGRIVRGKQRKRADGKTYLELNHYELLEMQWIKELRESKGLSFAIIAEMLEEKRAQLEGRERWPVEPYHGWRNRAWTGEGCKWFYRMYVKGGKPYPPPRMDMLTSIEKISPPSVDGPIKKAVDGFSPWEDEQRKSPLTRLAEWRKGNGRS